MHKRLPDVNQRPLPHHSSLLHATVAAAQPAAHCVQAGQLGTSPSPYQHQLKILELLLWKGYTSRVSRATWLASLFIRLAMTFALRRIVVTFQDSRLQYTQSKEIGPWNVHKAPAVRDALRVTIRSMRLTPAGRKAKLEAVGEVGYWSCGELHPCSYL